MRSYNSALKHIVDHYRMLAEQLGHQHSHLTDEQLFILIERWQGCSTAEEQEEAVIEDLPRSPHDPEVLSKELHQRLVEIGYRGSRDIHPETVNIDGVLHAEMKHGPFCLLAHNRTEMGRTYTVMDLTYYPEQHINPRPDYAGPVAKIEISTVLEEDWFRIPEFEKLMRAAGDTFRMHAQLVKGQNESTP